MWRAPFYVTRHAIERAKERITEFREMTSCQVRAFLEEAALTAKLTRSRTQASDKKKRSEVWLSTEGPCLRFIVHDAFDGRGRACVTVLWNDERQ